MSQTYSLPERSEFARPLSLIVRCDVGEITVSKAAVRSLDEENSTPVFESEAQQILFERVSEWLRELFGGVAVSSGGNEPLLIIQASGLCLSVKITPHSNGQLIVVTQCLVATGVEPTAELLWRLMQINCSETLGQLGIDEQGNLIASAALPADGITKEGLAGVLNIVAGVARECGSQLTARWGGSPQLNKLADES